MCICLFEMLLKVHPIHQINPRKAEHKPHGQKIAQSEKTTKQLLGELYSDKEYLEKLLQDEGVCQKLIFQNSNLSC